MSTIKDVAKRAGVSIATVSNYINKTRNVRPKTGEKIKEAIEYLNFQPNALAKNLKSSNVKDIGVILPTLDDSYYALILKGLESELRENGYDINVSFTEENKEKEKVIIENLLSKSKAGIVLVTCQPSNSDYFNKKIVNSDIPYVLIDRKIDQLDSNLIAFDNYATIKFLVRQMFGKNKKSIALVTGPVEYFSEKECVKGFKKAYREAHMDYDPELIIETDLSKEDAFKNMVKVFTDKHVDAVITSATLTAKGALEAAYIRNISNLSDLEVICLGEEIWNKYSNLIGIKSTMRTPFNMGVEAGKLLIKNIDEPVLFEKKNILLPDRITDKNNNGYHNNGLVVLEKRSKTIDKKIRILMLEGPGDKPIEGLLPNFTTNTGIEVEIVSMEQGDLFQEILKDASRDEALYDVYMFDQPWLNHLTSCNVLSDITKLKNEYGIDERDYLPGIYKSFCMYKTKTYGLPFIYGPQLLFYRKDLFEDKAVQHGFKKMYNIELKPPSTWSEFNAVAKYFTKAYNSDSPVRYGTAIANDSPFRLSPEFLMRLWSYDAQLGESDETFYLRTDAFNKALKNLSEAFDYTLGRKDPVTIEQSVKQFASGEVAMLVSYATYIPEINNRFSSDIVGKVGYGHVPGGKPVLSGWSLGISKKTNKKESAFRFINWACGKDISEYFTILKGQSPLLKVYNNDDLLRMYPWLTMLKDTYKYCKARKYPESRDLLAPKQLEIENRLFMELSAFIKTDKTSSDEINNLYNKLKRFNLNV